MGKLASIIARAGILPPEMLVEFKRWGHPVVVQPEPITLEQLDAQLEAALNEEDLVLMKVTDLESIKRYMKTQKKGTLHVVTEDDIEADIEVFYGTTITEDIVLPWSSESIGGLMCNGKTYLQVNDSSRLFFYDMQELFFGDTKAFMLCRTKRPVHGPE